VSGGNQNLGDLNKNEMVSFARTPALPGVELLMACGSSHHWRVFHERYAICTSDAAAAEIRYRKNSHTIGDRSTLIVRTG